MAKKGTVKWFNPNKGFGFIVPEDGGKDVFVHVSALSGKTVSDGQKVEFDLGEDRNGKPCAQNVQAA